MLFTDSCPLPSLSFSRSSKIRRCSVCTKSTNTASRRWLVCKKSVPRYAALNTPLGRCFLCVVLLPMILPNRLQRCCTMFRTRCCPMLRTLCLDTSFTRLRRQNMSNGRSCLGRYTRLGTIGERLRTRSQGGGRYWSSLRRCCVPIGWTIVFGTCLHLMLFL